MENDADQAGDPERVDGERVAVCWSDDDDDDDDDFIAVDVAAMAWWSGGEVQAGSSHRAWRQPILFVWREAQDFQIQRTLDISDRTTSSLHTY